MTQKQLSRTIFPIGEFKKDEIKKMASDIGIYPATRTESQEICFVGEGSYVDFIKKTDPHYMTPGPIMDENGNILGEHKGISGYTIGQRRGLGVSLGRPLYVVDIDIKKNALIVGPRERAFKRTFIVKDINWIAYESMTHPMKVWVKIRSTMKEEPATIYPLDEGLIKVEYDEPQWAPAPGQSAVFYEGDTVLGGGIIERILD
jgi:tRNA-specific 2-thiouridylase